MSPTKSPSPVTQVKGLLLEIPEDASFEEIQYRIHLVEKLEKGRRDARAGKVLTQKDVERRMSKWLTK